MKYSIGSNLDDTLVSWVYYLAKKYHIPPKNIEFFLWFPWFHLSLERFLHKSISLKSFIKHIKLIQNYWFQVRYIFNTFNVNLEDPNIDLCLGILKKINVTHLTVADRKLITYINNKWLFKIWISTVNRIDSIEKFEKFNFFTCDKIILSHSCNYDFKTLKDLCWYFHKKDIQVELVANELTRCDSKCHNCFAYLSMQKTKLRVNLEKVEDCCWTMKGINLYNQSNLIIPEQTNKYENIGIDCFKLGLRMTPTNRCLPILNSYFNLKHKWSFFDLLWDMHNEIFPFLNHNAINM